MGSIYGALNIAKENNKISVIPHTTRLKESDARQGFINVEEYLRLLKNVPNYLQTPLALAFLTGMRRGEILGLKWSQVDLKDGKITLTGMQTKNGKPRTIFLTKELVEILKMEKGQHPSSLYVYSHNRQRIIDFTVAWEKACKDSGLDGLRFHDLRRSAVRNLVRSG